MPNVILMFALINRVVVRFPWWPGRCPAMNGLRVGFAGPLRIVDVMSMPLPRGRGPLLHILALEVLLAVIVVVSTGAVQAWGQRNQSATDQARKLGPFYTAMADAGRLPAEPQPGDGASTGSYTWDCGRNEQHHRNTANVVVTPKFPGPPHHVHDYVGNLGVGDDSTVDSIAGAPTSCRNGDDSTYYWPVLRYVVAGPDEHGGPIQTPVSLTMTYLGNPRGPVLPMPRALRAAVGAATAYTTGGALARSWWTCSDTPSRQTSKYPVCDQGAAVVRIFAFPSCWDGRQLDSPDHRGQVVFPVAGGGCPVGTFAVPRLRITATYDIPPGTRYQIDAFDKQRNSPITDHAFLVNLMPGKLMSQVVDCLNQGKACTDHAP
jgi:hypothetical protein